MSFGFSSTYIALWAVVTFQGLLIMALLLKQEKLRQLVERGSSIPIGSSAPEFGGIDQRGQAVSLESLVAGGVILFLSPDCSACGALVESIGPLQSKLPPIVAVCRGESAPCASLGNRLEMKLITDASGQIAASYGASAFPRAVVIDQNKRIRGYSFPRTVDELATAFADSMKESDQSAQVSQMAEYKFSAGKQ